MKSNSSCTLCEEENNLSTKFISTSSYSTNYMIPKKKTKTSYSKSKLPSISNSLIWKTNTNIGLSSTEKVIYLSDIKNKEPSITLSIQTSDFLLDEKD